MREVAVLLFVIGFSHSVSADWEWPALDRRPGGEDAVAGVASLPLPAEADPGLYILKRVEISI